MAFLIAQSTTLNHCMISILTQLHLLVITFIRCPISQSVPISHIHMFLYKNTSFYNLGQARPIAKKSLLFDVRIEISLNE